MILHTRMLNWPSPVAISDRCRRFHLSKPVCGCLAQCLSFESTKMPFVRTLRKRLRRDSTAHLYPRKRDAEPLRVQRMEKLIREKSIISKQFHVKVRVKVWGLILVRISYKTRFLNRVPVCYI